MNPVRRFFREIRDTSMSRSERATLLVGATLVLALGSAALYMLVRSVVESYVTFGPVGIVVTVALIALFGVALYVGIVKDKDV